MDAGLIRLIASRTSIHVPATGPETNVPCNGRCNGSLVILGFEMSHMAAHFIRDDSTLHGLAMEYQTDRRWQHSVLQAVPCKT